MITVKHDQETVRIEMNFDTYARLLATLEDAIIYIDDPGSCEHPGEFADRLVSIQLQLGLTRNLWEDAVSKYHSEGRLFKTLFPIGE